jgi:hypothetical protein
MTVTGTWMQMQMSVKIREQIQNQIHYDNFAKEIRFPKKLTRNKTRGLWESGEFEVEVPIMKAE